MLLGNTGQIVHRVNGRVQIRLRMPELAKDGTAIHAMKHVIVMVGLVRESSVIQKHVEQTLAAFRLWCYSNRGTPWQRLRARAEIRNSYAWSPVTQE